MVHPMMTILGVVFVGVLCGAEGWDEMLVFAEGKRSWLATWLDLTAGLPSADTLRRVFSLLEPKVFEKHFRAWMLSLADRLRGKVLAIDGKTVKGVGLRGETPLHMVHVWAAEFRVLLASASTEGAPTEPEVTRQLLDLLKIEGAIVTMDANGCCRETMAKIVERKADWVCALKGNRGVLHDAVRTCFDRLEAEGKLEEVATHIADAERAHGRGEIRYVWAVDAKLAGLSEEKLPGIRSIVMVRRGRLIAGEMHAERTFYVASLAPKARKLADTIREHWEVENGLHWILDVAMREDACAVSTRTAAENLATVRRGALVLLRKDTRSKHGVKLKGSRASCDNDYLAHLLRLEIT